MLLLLALVIVGKAQTPLLSEGFEEGIPDTWTVVDYNFDDFTWTAGTSGGNSSPASAHTGTGYVYSRSWSSSAPNGGALTPNDWLISPAVTIPGTGNYDLTFWVCSMQDDYPQEHYGVYISTSSDPEDLSSYTLLYENTLEATHGGTPAQSQGYWQEVTVSLSGHSGAVHIAFRHINCTDQVAVCIDDIKVDVASTAPVLTVNPTSIQFGSAPVGSTFARKQFNVNGMNLTTNVTLTLPNGSPFGISTDTVNYSNTVTLTPNASGNVSSTIYVQFNPTAANYYESEISINSQIGTRTVTLFGMTVDCSQDQTIPWYETFTTEDFPANCWTLTSTDTNDFVQDGQVYPGYKYFTWYHSISSQLAGVRGDVDAYQDEHLYTPTFSLSNASGAADFAFDLRTNPNVQDKIDGLDRLEIRMSLDGGNTYTTIWNFLDIQAEFADYWSSWSDIWPVSFNMDQYLGTNSQIKFDFHYESELGAGGAGYPYFVQNVRFLNYFEPSINVMNTQDTIEFFTYIGDPQPIEIPVEGRNLTSTINVTTTSPYEVSLNGTDYATTVTLPVLGSSFYVRYNPTVNTTNDIATLIINSNYTDNTGTYPNAILGDTIVLIGNAYDCSTTVLPIAESFESEEGTVLAPDATEYCWSAIKINTADIQNLIVNSNNYAHSGNQSFRFASAYYNSQGIYDQYLISPELNAANTMLVMFNYANASALKDETFAVGYSTTGNDITDFTWEADITNQSSTDWQLYRNTNVPANVKYVAIHYKSVRQAYLYIDDFQIMEAPSCMFPVELKAESTTENSANILWTAGANETSWEMVYGTAPIDLTTATPSTVTTLGTTLNGLTANTHYQIAVRAICGEGHSDWSEIADFWTTTTPAMVPYTQTFEENDADRTNWVLVNGNEPNYFMYGNIVGSTSGKALIITNDGEHNVYMNEIDQNTKTAYYSTVWAYRDLQFPETTAPAFMLTLNWKCYGEVDYDFGEMFIGNATEVTNFERDENIPGFVDVNATHYTPAGLTKLDRFVNKAVMQNGAYLIPSDEVAGQVKRLYFLWTNDSLSGDDTPLAIDNINISIPLFANMSGVITDADNGNPIAGAIITMVSSQGFTVTATTDNTGLYTIEDVVATYYEITISANGYQTLSTGYSLSEGNNNVDYELTVEECAIIPSNVTYTIEEDNLILTWAAAENTTLQLCSEELQGYLGAVSATTYNCGGFHLYTPANLTVVNGGRITEVGIQVHCDPQYCDYSIRIYVGGSNTEGPASEVPVYEQYIDPAEVVTSGWTNVVLDEPYTIDGTQTLWIGYYASVHAPEAGSTYYPLWISTDCMVPGYSDILLWGGEFEAYGKDFMVRATVEAPEVSYNILSDGTVIASDIHEGEYVVSPYDPNACYQVTTTCENGEISNPSDCAVEVGINNVNVNNSFEVYPNPAHETVNVSTTMNVQKVEVLNYLGQVIYSQNTTNNNFTLNVANYADGVYFIRISGNDGIATQKLIKK